MMIMFATRSAAVFLSLFAFAVVSFAQSTSQEYPAAIVSNELTGTIKARDIGDSRLTTYYYTFNGEQGDIFINLVSRNFTGDIDVFTASGLKPLTKIVVYADQGELETGRVVYLRKPERLLLRVQGRTPNDDEAAFRLKFGGSFLAMKPEDVPTAPELPKVSAVAGNRVNSVGTIISRSSESVRSETEKEHASVEPAAPTGDPPADVAAKEDMPAAPVGKTETAKNSPPAPTRSSSTSPRPNRKNARQTASTTRNLGDRSTGSRAKQNGEKGKSSKAEPEVSAPPADAAPLEKGKAETAVSSRSRASERTRPAKAKEEPEPDPLASINLVVQFKSGEVLEKRMSEVFKFSIDKGILVVILKDGSVTRYPIIEVAKLTIE